MLPDDPAELPEALPEAPEVPEVPDVPEVPPAPPAPPVAREDPLEVETFRAVKKFNRAVKSSREPVVRENPSPGRVPDPPAPVKGRGIFDPFRRSK